MATARFAVHAHSDWSYDGHYPLPTVARLLACLGYRGVLMSEHDRGFDEDRWGAYREACARASSDRFLVVPGIEYSSPDNVLHVPVWGELPFLGEGLETAAMLGAVGEHRGAAVFAHPSRLDAWQRFDPEWTRHLLGLEVWNVKQDGYAPSAEGIDLWHRHPGLIPFADLDFHTGRHLFPLAMELRGEGPWTRPGVYAALRGRQLRGLAFTGPVESFTRGERRRRALTLERAHQWAFRRVKRVVRGHY